MPSIFAAWVIGTRATLKCLLAALLEPTARLRELEASGDLAGRLAWLEVVRAYEKRVLSARS